MVQIRINEKPRRFSVYVELLGFAVFLDVAVNLQALPLLPDVAVLPSIAVNLQSLPLIFWT